MPDAWIAALPMLVAGLVGVLAGGITTFLATYMLEREKWRQRKQDEECHDRRQALAGLLEWLGPIQSALTGAVEMTFQFGPDRPDPDAAAVMDEWPDLATKIGELDVPAGARYVLPSGLYEAAWPIIDELDALRSLALQALEQQKQIKFEGQKPDGDINRLFIADARSELFSIEHEMLGKLKELAGKAVAFRKELITAYREAYK